MTHNKFQNIYKKSYLNENLKVYLHLSKSSIEFIYQDNKFVSYTGRNSILKIIEYFYMTKLQYYSKK